MAAIEECMQILSEQGVTVSLPGELPGAVQRAIHLLDERHVAMEVAFRLVDLAEQDQVRSSDASEMRSCAEQISMLCLFAYEPSNSSGDLEDLIDKARQLGVVPPTE